jgi:hypothetical protein
MEPPAAPAAPAPPPAYEPPPGPPAYEPAPVMAGPPPPRRGRGPLLAIVLVVVLLIVVVGGYAVGGFVYAQGKLNSATDSYNGVVDHENKLTDQFNQLNNDFNKTDLSTATADSLNQEKSLYQQLATQSQSAQPTVTADDATLASASAGLSENQWLTALSRSSLDKESTKIGYARQALGVAKTILADSIQYANFYAAVDQVFIDFYNLGKTDSSNISAIVAAVATLKADIAKAIPLDQAPGVSPQMASLMTVLQKLANDFSSLLTDAQSGNTTNVQTDLNNIDADTTKLDGFDFTAISNSEQTYYKNLIDQFNSFVDKANKA